MRPWIIAPILLAAAIAQAEDPSDITFERLAKVHRFAFGGTGYAGLISQGEKDYKVILSRPSALADFDRLLSVGNPQAKSYALVGIRTLNLNRFTERSQRFRDSKENVSMQSGCMLYEEPLTAVVKGIAAGEYSKTK